MHAEPSTVEIVVVPIRSGASFRRVRKSDVASQSPIPLNSVSTLVMGQTAPSKKRPQFGG
jgi:hypothetical protein